MSAGRLQISVLPNGQFVVVLDAMPHADADMLADFDTARQALIDAGAAAVLRFDHPLTSSPAWPQGDSN